MNNSTVGSRMIHDSMRALSRQPKIKSNQIKSTIFMNESNHAHTVIQSDSIQFIFHLHEKEPPHGPTSILPITIIFIYTNIFHLHQDPTQRLKQLRISLLNNNFLR